MPLSRFRIVSGAVGAEYTDSRNAEDVGEAQVPSVHAHEQVAVFRHFMKRASSPDIGSSDFGIAHLGELFTKSGKVQKFQLCVQ